MESFDVGVIGAGIHGVSAASHLAGRGARVVLVDPRPPAGGPTGRSSAICRAYYTNTFLARCARDSIAMFEDFEAVTGTSAGFVRTGFLYLHPAADADGVAASAARLRELGIAVDVVPADAIGRARAGVRPRRCRRRRVRAWCGVRRPARRDRRAVPGSDTRRRRGSDRAVGRPARHDRGRRRGPDARRRHGARVRTRADRGRTVDAAARGAGRRRAAAHRRAARGGDLPLGVGRSRAGAHRSPGRLLLPSGGPGSVPGRADPSGAERRSRRRRRLDPAGRGRGARAGGDRSRAAPRGHARSTAGGRACTTSARTGSP